MAKVTGIGGVFIKSRQDKQVLSKWYQDNLGIKLEDWGGAILNWKEDAVDDGGMTVWTVADKDTDWFSPSEAGFMINYRVDDMAGMLDHLKSKGVDILDGPESHENGKFAWIMDPEGNKVELWEPMPWDEKNKEGQALQFPKAPESRLF